MTVQINVQCSEPMYSLLLLYTDLRVFVYSQVMTPSPAISQNSFQLSSSAAALDETSLDVETAESVNLDVSEVSLDVLEKYFKLCQ